MIPINTKWQWLVLVVITLIAGYLRFASINFGLPDHVRPDEEHLVPKALGLRTDPRPAVYPQAQTYVVHGILRLCAVFTGPRQDLRSAYAKDNGARAFSIARWVTAAMGTATIIIVYLAAAPIYGPIAAIVSSTIVAVCFIHVRDSKFAKTEVPAGFWLALTVLMMLRIPTRGRSLHYGLAGLFCGLAAATHYPSGAIAIGIFVAHLEARRREGKSLFGSLVDPRIYVAGFIAIVAFAAANPSFILDWKQTMSTYSAMRDAYRWWNGGYSPAGFGWPWLFFLAMPRGFGVGLELFLVAALIWAVVRRQPGTLALLAFVLVCFWSFINGHPQLEIRYLINPLLAMALLGGVFASDILERTLPRIGAVSRFDFEQMRPERRDESPSDIEQQTSNIASRRRWPGWIALFCGALLMAPSVVRDLQMNHLLHQTDTRTIARQWMIGHIPQGSTLAMIGGDSYGKPKIGGLYHVISTDLPLNNKAAQSAGWAVSDSAPQLSLWSKGLTDAEVAQLNANGALEFDIDPVRSEAAAPVFDPNDAFYVPFNHITSMLRPGPRIRIWKLATPPSPPNG
jgi:Dolichyl-phosphate-mannose-protein mannosyltransferase